MHTVLIYAQNKIILQIIANEPAGKWNIVGLIICKKKFISTNFGELKAKRKMLLKIAAKHKQKHNE